MRPRTVAGVLTEPQRARSGDRPQQLRKSYMYYALYTLNVLVMLVAPVLLGRWIARRRGVGWGLFGIGAATFVASQVGHLPFNWLVLERFALFGRRPEEPFSLIALSIFLGLSAGLFEEVARFLTYRYWATETRSWGQGLMLGAGHGGVEAILLGLVTAINTIFLFAYRADYVLIEIPADLQTVVDEQVAAAFTLPWYVTVLGGVERLFTLCFHLAASLLVMQGFVSGRRWRWLGAAVAWHALADGLVVYVSQVWNVYAAEVLVGVAAVLSLWMVFRLKRPEPPEPELPPLAMVGAAGPLAIGLTEDQLERSKYG
ncbi:MAG: YhfC family glutamic-type intramembrane protease [Chloroflexota bacterium]